LIRINPLLTTNNPGDERLKIKSEKSTLLTHTGLFGELEHLKIKTRLIDEMFASVMGQYVIHMCVLEVIDTPSILSVICKATVLERVLSTFPFMVAENTVRWKWKIFILLLDFLFIMNRKIENYE
jgi:hypothetical protein